MWWSPNGFRVLDFYIGMNDGAPGSISAAVKVSRYARLADSSTSNEGINGM